MTATAERTPADTTLGSFRKKFLDAEGNFDPTLLPMLEIEDKKGQVKSYLQVVWRILWWNHQHPMGSRYRITTDVVHEQHSAYVVAEIIDTEVDRYLHDPAGNIAVIPSADGSMRAAINPKHVLYSDRKYITPCRVGDPTEKAITGAIGRVLARAGFGTEGAMELESDDGDGDFVDGPLEDPERERVLQQIEAAATSASLLDRLGAIAQEVAGPDASSETMTVEDLRKMLERVKATARDARKPTPRGRTTTPLRPAPNNSRAAEDEVLTARNEMLRLQEAHGLSDDEIIVLIREVKGDDPWEPGDPLDPLDYVAVAAKIIANRAPARSRRTTSVA